MVFCGTFTTRGLDCTVGNGRICITREGEVHKFVKKAAQRTFSAEYAAQQKQPVLYITERAVFSLAGAELMLVEIAPGIDLEKDILAHMDFTPLISSQLKEMDPVFFSE